MHTRKGKLLFIFSLMMVVSVSIWGQYTYSHFWMRELRLNPALTGLMAGTWKLGYDKRFFRDDSMKSNWSTAYVEFKKSFYKKVGEYAKDKEPTGWTIGYGFMDDRRRGNFEHAYYISDYLSVSFLKVPKKQEKHDWLLGLGMQLGFLRDGSRNIFDVNVGIVGGKSTILCWQEDQVYKYEWGVAAYHIFQPWRKDTSYVPGRTIHAHGGALVKYNKNLHLVVQVYGGYSNQPDLVVGGYALLFPDVHYYYWDRFRIGAHYRLTNHLVLTTGVRIFGRSKKSVAMDFVASYDLPMKFMDFKSPYKHAWELGFYIYPHEKCWNLSPCAML